MLQLVRIALLVLLTVIFVSALGGVLVATTGILEKVVLVAGAVLIAVVVSRVRRQGPEKATSR